MSHIDTALHYAWTYKLPIYIALREFFGQIWSALSASLPNPDDPSDWPFSHYRLFYKTVRLWNNQKPQPVAQVTLPK